MSSKLRVGTKVYVGQKELVVQKELGSGAFGTVYKVWDEASGRTRALKQVICDGGIQNVDAVLREARTLAGANHERIVRYLGFERYKSSSGTSCLILTEFCAGGDLNTRLNDRSTRQKNMKWIWQLSEALAYLHSRNPRIVHRDLKADNVLLTNRNEEDLKIGDFGLAREYHAMRSNDAYSSESAQMYYMTSGLGPIHWMAPEFYEQHYTEKADVFSLAGIFYAILTRDYILCSSKKMYGVYLTYQWHGKVGLGYAMTFDANAEVIFPSDFQGSNAVKRLVENMLDRNPHNRPSASEVKDSVANIRSSVNMSASSASEPNGSCC